MRRAIICIFVLILVGGIQSYAQEETTVVEQIIGEYESGDISGAEYLALRALKNSEKYKPEELLEIHKYLAFCYIARGERNPAIKEFIEVLNINPNFRFRRELTSPKVISIFDEALREFRQIQLSKKELPQDKQSLIWIEAAKRSILFPGLGQLHKGQKTKGYTLMGAEVATLSSLVYFSYQYDKAHDDYLDAGTILEIEDAYDKYNSFYKLRNASAIVAAGIYIYSILDCLYSSPVVPGTKFSLRYDSARITAVLSF